MSPVTTCDANSHPRLSSPGNMHGFEVNFEHGLKVGNELKACMKSLALLSNITEPGHYNNTTIGVLLYRRKKFKHKCQIYCHAVFVMFKFYKTFKNRIFTLYTNYSKDEIERLSQGRFR